MNPNEIVVGLDGSPGSAAALRWAAAESRLRAVPLRVLHTWQLPAAEEVPAGAAFREASAADARARATRWAADALGEHEAQVPRVLDVVEGPAGPVLVERARRAALLVVGTREHVGLRRLVAGSVSHYCLSHAECPVVAVAQKIRVRVGVPPLRRQQPTSMGPLL